MFKQVFTKLFRSNDDTRNITDKGANISPDITDINRYDRAPIYAIPTISSCFQSSGYSSSAPMNDYYNLYNENKASNTNSNNNSNINNNGNKSSQIKSVSSSLSSSTSSSSTSSSASSTCTTSSINNKTKTKSDRKYDDSNTRQIYIAPHCIRYSNSTLDDTIYRIDDDSLNEIATEILESDNLPPKLQIVYYAGKYFAINNSHLQIYKQLQLSGLITHVQADVISVEAIPFALRQHLLQTPSNSANSNEISDEEYGDELTFDNINRSGACSSSSGVSAGSSAISSHGMADILTPANIEMLNKEMLVDETYEFGTCENCLDSDNEEEDEQSNSFKILTNQNGSLKIDENLIDKIEENYLFKSYRNVEDDEDDDEECDDEDDEEDFDDDNFYNNTNNNNNEETENFNSKVQAREIVREELKDQHEKWRKKKNNIVNNTLYNSYANTNSILRVKNQDFSFSDNNNNKHLPEDFKNEDEWQEHQKLCVYNDNDDNQSASTPKDNNNSKKRRLNMLKKNNDSNKSTDEPELENLLLNGDIEKAESSLNDT